MVLIALLFAALSTIFAEQAIFLMLSTNFLIMNTIIW